MIKLLTDSVASIPAEVANQEGIEVVSLFIHDGETEYVDATMDLAAFYEKLPDMVDNLPTSSQPSQHTLECIFERAAEAGDEILAVFISSKLSGTFDGALRAARAVRARHINFKAAVIDSLSAGYDQAFPVFEAARAIKAGKTLEECAQAVVDAIERTRFLFAPKSLTYLQKGGRIGAAKALLGNLIQLAPVLTVRDGSPIDVAKVRTQKKVLAALFERFKADAESKTLKDVVVHYIGEPSAALAWARDVVQPYVGRAVQVLPVSPVVGLHVGPAVGVAYECERKLEGKVTHDPSTLVAFV